MSQANHYDVIIIGSGAGGGTLAYKLAPSGKRILLLERGDYVAREKDNWDSRAVNVDGKYQTKEKWRDEDGKELHPHTNYYVGGNTKFYGSALFRLRIRCSTCDGYPCLVNAKSDAQVCCVDPALAHPNVTLLTNAHVRRLETGGTGREVSKVIVERNGAVEEYSASIVVVSCGAINSAALLLRSENDKHPRGLANSSDVVGRHYMGHVNSVLMAISKCPNPTVFQKTLAVNDYYFRSPEWDFPMGHISFVGKLDGETLKAGAPAIAPGWTLDLLARHSLDFWLTSEDLPDPDNRVTLDRNGNIVLSYEPNNQAGHQRLTAKLKELLQQQTACSIHGHGCH